MERQYDWITAYATVALFFATLVLAITAVYQDRLRALVQKPKIRLDTGPIAKHVWRGSAPAQEKDTQGEPYRLYWLRMQITNQGTEAARELEIFASDLERSDGAGSFSRVSNFISCNFRWAFGQDVVMTDISPGMDKYCDIGRIMEARGREFFEQYSPEIKRDATILVLAVFPRHNNMSFLLEPGHYRILLKVGGSNARTRSYWLYIGFTERWLSEQDDMRQSLDLRLVPV